MHDPVGSAGAGLSPMAFHGRKKLQISNSALLPRAAGGHEIDDGEKGHPDEARMLVLPRQSVRIRDHQADEDELARDSCPCSSGTALERAGPAREEDDQEGREDQVQNIDHSRSVRLRRIAYLGYRSGVEETDGGQAGELPASPP